MIHSWDCLNRNGELHVQLQDAKSLISPRDSVRCTTGAGRKPDQLIRAASCLGSVQPFPARLMDAIATLPVTDCVLFTGSACFAEVRRPRSFLHAHLTWTAADTSVSAVKGTLKAFSNIALLWKKYSVDRWLPVKPCTTRTGSRPTIDQKILNFGPRFILAVVACRTWWSSLALFSSDTAKSSKPFLTDILFTTYLGRQLISVLQREAA